ncbi:RNA polymerase sigma factor [Limoniibacter endophyticus]|uniref:RNA polymerase sigma factor n=2 Tax=Limoniibacter endophyticus TaxID=1565040 RepID=A0A8J3DFG1_9HYPH|nr:RNA polymerase sigma factor [Limoniibacter endophyticus]
MPAMHHFARRFYANPNDVEDLVQDTLLKAMASLQTFTPGTRLKSWLFTIMRNTFYNRYRVEKRQLCLLDGDVGITATTAPAQEWSLAQSEVLTAMDDLPRHYRDALSDIVFDDMSYESAAQKRGCAIGTVKSRVNRARARLTGILG